MKKVYNKFPWICLLLIGLSLFLIISFKKYDSLIDVSLDGQIYSLNFVPGQGYIEYEGTKHPLLSDKSYKLIDIAVGDIDRDGRDNILVLEGEKTSQYGDTLIVYDILAVSNGLQIREIYRNKMSAVRPWKIEVCEIDNDGEMEIFIAVNKATRLYKDIENRPFFFNFKNNILVKKWTGSKLRAPFTDVLFMDLNVNGSDEFIAIEALDEDQFVVSVYYWFGFGFILQGESHIYDRIDSVEAKIIQEEPLIHVNIVENGRIKSVILEPSVDKTQNGIYLLKERGK